MTTTKELRASIIEKERERAILIRKMFRRAKLAELGIDTSQVATYTNPDTGRFAFITFKDGTRRKVGLNVIELLTGKICNMRRGWEAMDFEKTSTRIPGGPHGGCIK